jgi:hypothetical protein
MQQHNSTMNGERTPDENVGVPANPAPTPVTPPVNPPPTSQPVTVQQFNEVEERMTAFERTTVRLTRYGLAVTILTGIFIALQWLEIRTGSVDTHELAVQAKNQADRTKDIADLYIKVARQSNEMPDVRVSQSGEYHDEKTKQVGAWIYYRNVANRAVAENPSVVIKLDIRALPPSQGERTSFLDGEFRNITPNRLPPVSKLSEQEISTSFVEVVINRQISLEDPEKKVYVWGEFRYKDFTNTLVDVPTRFCLYATVKQVLSVRNWSSSDRGMYKSLENCDKTNAANN